MNPDIEDLVHAHGQLLIENTHLRKQLAEARSTIARLKTQCHDAGQSLSDALERLRYHCTRSR